MRQLQPAPIAKCGPRRPHPFFSTLLSRALVFGVLLLGAPAASLEDVRRFFLAEVNRERATRGREALRLSDSLCKAAQERAEEIVRHGYFDGRGLSGGELLAEAAHAGYEADFIAELETQVSGDAALALGGWRGGGGDAWNELVGGPHRDLGIGAARLNDVPLYVLFVATNAADAFAVRTSPLHDLKRARTDLLSAVNRERAAHGLPPLRRNPRLESAAQGHADDMLRRRYYGHTSPEGADVMRRVKAAGYAPIQAGENLAKGVGPVAETVARWMGSAAHRENILNPAFMETGVGIAVGRMPEGNQVLWVQVFGSPR